MKAMLHKTPKRLPAVFLLVLLSVAVSAHGATPAGYTEYFIPGDEFWMRTIFDDLDANDDLGSSGFDSRMTSIITITGWSPAITVYYDHWEDGYDFDPDNPATADETYILAERGDIRTFASENIPVPQSPVADCGAGTCLYDGRDRIYVAGGATTCTRVSWPSIIGSTFAVAWEVYPVKPQLTTYILPFGEDLAAVPSPNLQDFKRVYTLIQATADGTTVTVDLDGDGIPDPLDQNRDGDLLDPGDGTTVNLDAGETFLLDRTSAAVAALATGAVIQGSHTLQVQYIVGDDDPDARFEIRGLSAFPRGYWDDEYYAPVDSADEPGDETDIYLHNAEDTALTVDWETVSTAGSFTIPARSTVSFFAMTGAYAPQGSAVYLKGSGPFWGVSTIDTEDTTHDWGYSLVPAFLLEDENFMGWAPGAYATPIPAADYDDSGMYITSAQDNIRVFIDTDGDGTADQTYDLNRLESLYVWDPVDGDLSGAHVWATGPYTIAYGQNPDTAPAGLPALDLGYTAIPGSAFIDKVLTVEKTADPSVVPLTAGSETTFTLLVRSYDFAVDDISVAEFLPDGWAYVDGSTVIDLADKSTLSGAAADPVSGTTTTTTTLIYADTFASGTYTSNADNTPAGLAWASGWVEENDGGGVAGGGDVLIEADGGSNALRIKKKNKAIARRADLTGATAATLRFDYRRQGVQKDFRTDVQVCDNASVVNPNTCTTAWRTVATFVNTQADAAYQPFSVDLTTLAGFNFAATNFALRFSTVAATKDKEIFIDNVAVQITTTETLPGGLAWDETVLGSMDANQTLTIRFTARTTRDFDVGDLSRNVVEARGTRTVGGVLQTFAASDFAFVTYGDLVVEKTSEAPDPLLPGDTFTYTVTVTHPGTAGAYSGIAVYDPLPPGVTHVPGSTRVDGNPFDGAPPNFIGASDGFFLGPGESLALTFDVTVDTPLPTGVTTLTNTASVTTAELRAGVTAEVTDTVLNPSLESARVGGRVWLDADGDGVEDPGEPGLSNVTVTLKDRFGTPVATAVTGIDGAYTFPGVAPGTGYYVEVTAGLPDGLEQTAPSGRGDNRTDPFDLNPGDSLAADPLGFGPPPGTVIIGDLVWSDANGNGARDPGEPGLAGVTVVLRDGGGAVVATRVTDAGGNYLFIGPAGTYTVQVDPDALAPNFTLTTPSQVQAGALTAGDAFLDADFGFLGVPGQTHTISDRVWDDVNGDGVVDGSEPGISGVTVDLLDSGGRVIATTVSGPDGTFSFTGVPGNGADYTVRITDTAGVLADVAGTTPWAVAGERPIDNLNGDLSDASFGYRVPAGLKKIATGTVWRDENANGVIDPLETGYAGVTLDIYLDDGDGVFEPGTGDGYIGTVTTDGAGDYTFAGLPPGAYWVQLTDTAGVLTGATAVYEPTEGTVSPFNGLELVDLTAPGVGTGIDFGFIPQPTLAILSHFGAYTQDGQVVVRWETASEVGTVGFDLYRKDGASGTFRRLNDTLLPGLIVSRQGGTYRFVDADAEPGGTYTYKLAEAEARGATRVHGPYTVTVDGPVVDLSSDRTTFRQALKAEKRLLKRYGTGRPADPAPMAGPYHKAAKVLSDHEKARVKAAKKTRAAVEKLKKQRSAAGAKIAVTRTGMVLVAAEQLAAVLDIPTAEMQARIRKHRLALSHMGQAVAYSAAGDGGGLLFYGQAPDTLFARENIYRVRPGKGLKMQPVKGRRPGAAEISDSFTETVLREENRWALTALYDDPLDDYWAWEFIVAGDMEQGEKVLSISSDGVDPTGGPAFLTVLLKGGSDTEGGPDHHVRIHINGSVVGEGFWDGTADHAVQLEVDPGLLNDGENTVTVTGLLDTGAPYSVFYLNALELTYPRLFRAADNRLAFTAETAERAETYAVDGFTGPDIRVFDLTDPARPGILRHTVSEATAQGWRVRFAPANPDTGYARYLAVTPDAFAAPAAVVADTDAAGYLARQRADYLLIAPEGLKAAAQSLADYREAQGHATLVVGVDEIMDAFNHGVFSPDAIRDFLAHAFHRWPTAPQWVVLVGEGNFDYQDFMGHGDNLVPTLMVPTPFGLFASDNRFADVAGDDGVPEMAVGRLPVVSAEELHAVLDKIRVFESGLRNRDKRVLLLADNPDPGGNFPVDSDHIGTLMPPAYAVEKVYMSEMSFEGARLALQEGLTRGAVFLNYFGHGGVDRMAREGVLRTADVAGMDNLEQLPVVTAMTCIMGQFAIPGYDALSEALVLHPAGGAVAVLSPSGLVMNDLSKILDEAFFTAVFERPSATLGGIIQQAFGHYSTRGDRYIMEINGLLGDPGLRLP